LNLYALDATRGRVLAAVPIGGRFYGGPAIPRGRVFLGNADSGAVIPNYIKDGNIFAVGLPFRR
jgi:hypothetical protein